MSIEIKNRWSNKVLYIAENAQDVRQALREALDADANLRDANLRDANLRDANLRDANLRDANLRGANLRDANLRGANLRGANLLGANLRGANLRGANLRDANLLDANLRGANLRDANLRGANLLDANLRGANLRGANLWRHPLWPMRQDFFSILDQAPAEVGGLRKAMVEGRINGSAYEGECACLVGTIANVHGCSVDELKTQVGIPRNVDRPAEQWFIVIEKGDKPLDVTDESINWSEQSEGVSRLSWALLWLDEWVESRTAIAQVLSTPVDVKGTEG